MVVFVRTVMEPMARWTRTPNWLPPRQPATPPTIKRRLAEAAARLCRR